MSRRLTLQERDLLQAENAKLREQAADDKLAFDHANEVVGKLEEDLKEADGLLRRLRIKFQ